MLSAAAYVLLESIRRVALAGTLRLKLLKIGAVMVVVRNIDGRAPAHVHASRLRRVLRIAI